MATLGQVYIMVNIKDEECRLKVPRVDGGSEMTSGYEADLLGFQCDYAEKHQYAPDVPVEQRGYRRRLAKPGDPSYREITDIVIGYLGSDKVGPCAVQAMGIDSWRNKDEGHAVEAWSLPMRNSEGYDRAIRNLAELKERGEATVKVNPRYFPGPWIYQIPMKPRPKLRQGGLKQLQRLIPMKRHRDLDFGSLDEPEDVIPAAEEEEPSRASSSGHTDQIADLCRGLTGMMAPKSQADESTRLPSESARTRSEVAEDRALCRKERQPQQPKP